jgi:putative membrane protein
MFMRKSVASIAVAGLLALAACSGPVKDDKAADFVAKASVANLFEIQTSELALQRSQNPEVRALAQAMITDHTKAGADLQAALTAAKSTLMPATTLDEAHQKKYEDLANAKPEAFDDKYVDIQTDAHNEAVALFKDYSDGGMAGPVKDFAAATLPVLEGHKAKVDTIDDVTHSGATNSAKASEEASESAAGH